LGVAGLLAAGLAVLGAVFFAVSAPAAEVEPDARFGLDADLAAAFFTVSGAAAAGFGAGLEAAGLFVVSAAAVVGRVVGLAAPPALRVVSVAVAGLLTGFTGAETCFVESVACVPGAGTGESLIGVAAAVLMLLVRPVEVPVPAVAGVRGAAAVLPGAVFAAAASGSARVAGSFSVESGAARPAVSRRAAASAAAFRPFTNAMFARCFSYEGAKMCLPWPFATK
jgi:hypothetical protein